MSTLQIRASFLALIVLLLSDSMRAQELYEPSASPAPVPAELSRGDDYSPLSAPETGAPVSLSPEVASASPPAPPLDDEVDDMFDVPSPSPAPLSSSNFGKDVSDGEFSDLEYEDSSGGGNKAAAGITVAVIMGVCIVGLGGVVYKKRRDNIKRMHMYEYSAARMDNL